MLFCLLVYCFVCVCDASVLIIGDIVCYCLCLVCNVYKYILIISYVLSYVLALFICVFVGKAGVDVYVCLLCVV